MDPNLVAKINPGLKDGKLKVLKYISQNKPAGPSEPRS
jgi:hypothetical protein